MGACASFSIGQEAEPDELSGFEQDYHHRLNGINAEDAAAHYELALWALDHYDKRAKNIEALDVTLDELDLALELDPNLANAKALRAAVEEQHENLHRKLNPDFMKMAFAVIGGLGIFLLGMKNMSEGVQAVAGHRLRRMIGAVTDNRFLAIGTGLVVTCLVQSSSITTVLVVGFVNSGIMLLHQAVGVIMGANIGTTITGWILVLNIGKWGLPIMGISAFAFLFSRSERLRYVAMAVMGVGMVFFGLELMKNGFKPMKDFPAFEEAFAWFRADSYVGILKCASIGCLLTFLVQSSSATLGITIGLASVGAIPFETAAALVLGENIGTTITAWLASIGATTNAKRAAYAHVLFNVFGVAWVTAAFPLVLRLVGQLVEGTTGTSPIGIHITDVDDAATFATVVTAGIATTHTMFNLTNTVVFIPLVRIFSRFLERLVPDRDIKESPHLTFLDVRMLDTPSIGLQQSLDEIIRMGEGVDTMLDQVRDAIGEKKIDEARKTKLFRREEILDCAQKDVTEFLSKLLSGHIPMEVTIEGRQQLRIADEVESISDYIANLMKLHLKLRGEGMELTEEGRRDLESLHDKVAQYVRFILGHLRHASPDVLSPARADAEAVTHLMKDCRERHLARVSDQGVSPLKSLIFTDMLTAYRKIGDHAYNIAEALGGEK